MILLAFCFSKWHKVSNKHCLHHSTVSQYLHFSLLSLSSKYFSFSFILLALVCRINHHLFYILLFPVLVSLLAIALLLSSGMLCQRVLLGFVCLLRNCCNWHGISLVSFFYSLVCLRCTYSCISFTLCGVGPWLFFLLSDSSYIFYRLFQQFCHWSPSGFSYLVNSLSAVRNSFCCWLIVSLYFVTRLSTLFMYSTTVATIAASAVSITTRNVPLSDDVSFVRTFHVSLIVSLSTIFSCIE